MAPFQTQEINTDHGPVLIRPFELRDIASQAAYLFDTPNDFRESIGLDPGKLADRAAWEISKKSRQLNALAKGDLPTAVVAEMNGTAISMVYIDKRIDDKFPQLHFHIFDPDFRGKGLGSIIFMAGAEIFSSLYGTKRFFIEPKASNERMNRLMKKLGFKYIKNFVLEAGPMTHEMMVSQYEIDLSNYIRSGT